MGIPLGEEGARCFSPPATRGILPGLLCLRDAEGAKTMPLEASARTRPRWEQADAAASPPTRECKGSDWQEARSPRMRRETRPVS